MTAKIKLHAARLLRAASVAALFTAAPIVYEFDATSGSILVKQSAATAKDGGSDDGGSDGDKSGPGPGSSGRDDHGNRQNDRNGADRVGANGEKIKVEGNDIEVTYRDGFKEILENGILRMEDPRGRTVVQRRSTPADVARLQALVH